MKRPATTKAEYLGQLMRLAPSLERHRHSAAWVKMTRTELKAECARLRLGETIAERAELCWLLAQAGHAVSFDDHRGNHELTQLALDVGALACVGTASVA